MSFLIDFLRPTASEGPSWYSVLKKAGGGCNDLLYSGHMLVAVLTAMAWTVSPLYLLKIQYSSPQYNFSSYPHWFQLGIYRRLMEASAQLSYGSLCCIVPRERYENTTTTVLTASLQSMSASFYGRWRVFSGLPRIHPRPGGSRNSRKSKARWSKLQKTRTLTRWGNYWRKSSWVAKRARRTDPRVKPCGCFPAWPYSQPLSLFSWLSRGPATVDRCLSAQALCSMYLFPSYLPRDDDIRGCDLSWLWVSCLLYYNIALLLGVFFFFQNTVSSK